MCKPMRVVIDAKDLELAEGILLALRENGLLRDGNDVQAILEAFDEATPVPEMPTGGGLALL